MLLNGIIVATRDRVWRGGGNSTSVTSVMIRPNAADPGENLGKRPTWIYSTVPPGTGSRTKNGFSFRRPNYSFGPVFSFESPKTRTNRMKSNVIFAVYGFHEPTDASCCVVRYLYDNYSFSARERRLCYNSMADEISVIRNSSVDIANSPTNSPH